jgi:hypothetical protein
VLQNRVEKVMIFESGELLLRHDTTVTCAKCATEFSLEQLLRPPLDVCPLRLTHRRNSARAAAASQDAGASRSKSRL